MVAQLDLPMPPPPKARIDFAEAARRELRAALEKARASTAAAPWDRRTQDYWRVVAPQMSGWLPPAEQAEFLAAFAPELDRIEGMLS